MGDMGICVGKRDQLMRCAPVPSSRPAWRRPPPPRRHLPHASASSSASPNQGDIHGGGLGRRLGAPDCREGSSSAAAEAAPPQEQILLQPHARSLRHFASVLALSHSIFLEAADGSMLATKTISTRCRMILTCAQPEWRRFCCTDVCVCRVAVGLEQEQPQRWSSWFCDDAMPSAISCLIGWYCVHGRFSV